MTTAFGFGTLPGVRTTRLASWWRNTLNPALHKTLQLPRAYLSYVGLSAMDGLCTGAILALGGWEVNPIANAVLARFGFPGMIVFKFFIVAMVILMCEKIVREKPRAGRAVMAIAIAATMVPVLVAALEFACYVFWPG
ncbi:DUF5658 family protein [Algisphaera agarilytica]|uniref:Putative membrane protein n=1 Tax=Algisphaera agarilytica TaxID=1385975 RepID=A0A7X0H7A3_9BACT|nr:DUF5658 family protein [Algisphaera agarilytica]MBB6430583.1 putative membrane protein [Algisphaera agarilytica]